MLLARPNLFGGDVQTLGRPCRDACRVRGSPPLAATAARTDDTAVGCGNSGAATATYAGALSARLLPMKACQSMDTLPSAMPGCLVYC